MHDGSRDLVLGTAGHIDHGKTALVRALTGIDTDRLPEEKARGISIELGFAHLDLARERGSARATDGEGSPRARLGIVDVPGHERFIRNMLAGASGIDVALLVVAADDSVMPQTREHLAILELLGVRDGVIAITKADLAEPSWLELVREDVALLVRGTFLEGKPVVATSIADGRSIDDLRRALTDLAMRAQPRRAEGAFRMAIDRSFVLRGLGTVVTGTVGAGRCAVGDSLDWLPSGKTVRVRGIERHDEPVDHITAGQRAAIHLSGAHHAEIVRGHVLAEAGLFEASALLTVRIDVLANAARPLRHRSRVRLHLGTQEVSAAVRLLDGTSIEPGASAIAQLDCAEAAFAVGGQPFVIREESPAMTIGGGRVLEPRARRRARRDPTAIARLEEIISPDPASRAAAAACARGDAGLGAEDLCQAIDVSRETAATLASQLEADHVLVRIETGGARSVRYLHSEALCDVAARIETTLARLHERTPLAHAIPRERLVQECGQGGQMLSAVLDRLAADGSGSIIERDGGFALRGFAPVLTAAQQRLRDEVIEAYRSAAFSPPEPEELARRAGVEGALLRPILDLCESEARLARLDGAIYLHCEWADELRRRVCARLEESAEGLTVSEIRDLLDTTRKHAVPICEHLDRIGLTKRVGDRRVLAPGVAPGVGTRFRP